ncbi:MAG: hypothetical protein M1814_004380 [Vezdaea aestivalis]|nr:MAG: hypothetical protein M1814_004380 [Vezdaea aestivalis]
MDGHSPANTNQLLQNPQLAVEASTPTPNRQGTTDIAMPDSHDASAIPSIKQATPSPGATPNLVSDNPLDAPSPPRPQNDTAEKEDEEMGGTADDSKRENETPGVGDAGNNPDGATTEGQQNIQTKASIESTARSHLIAQTHSIILPSYASWFDMATINEIEKKAVPEFFNSRNRSKTPQTYTDYRDFIINTYRLNPTEYLSVTAIRRNLAGDVCAICRIHAMLEQWGLINYQVDPEIRPSVIAPPFTGHYRVTLDTPRGLQTYQPGPNSGVSPGKPHPATERIANATPTKVEPITELRRNIYDPKGKEITSPSAQSSGENKANGEGSAPNGTPAETGNKVEDVVQEIKKPLHCSVCSTDCARIRYHSAKSQAANPDAPAGKTGLDLCPNCYLDGRFPGASVSADFVKLEDPSYSTIRDRDAPWSDSEMLLLLEGLECFDDDWSAVAEHVGSRSRDQCVLKFLQLEIEDPYLDSEPANTAKGPSGYTQALGLPAGRTPFSQADNPVMSVVAFLAGLADPAVTAATAGKAIKVQRKIMQARLEKSSKSSEATKGKGKTPENAVLAVSKPVDAMEIDTDTTPNPLSKEDPMAALSIIAISSGAGRSSALASHDERILMSGSSGLVNGDLSKFDQKLKQFNEMELVMQAERRDLEKARQQLFLDRLAFNRRVIELEKQMGAANLEMVKGGQAEDKDRLTFSAGAAKKSLGAETTETASTSEL